MTEQTLLNQVNVTEKSSTIIALVSVIGANLMVILILLMLYIFY